MTMPPSIVLVGVPEDSAQAFDTLPARVFGDWDSEFLEALSQHLRVLIVHERVLASEQLGSRLRMLKQRCPLGDILIWTPTATPAFVRQCLKAGVRDVVLDAQPGPLKELALSLLQKHRALPQLLKMKRARTRRRNFEGIISRSQAMWDVFERCVRIAPTDASVLILGETGTGKELLARAIHRLSKREGRFVALDCGAIPETLIESQLFGHVKGSFTGASRDKAGLFRNAHKGTLFFDEVGNISRSAQVSLLRAIQEGRVRPVGANREVEVDVRIIAATNESLEQAVREGQFREDLYFRLNVMSFILPPLRQRTEDILCLLEYFLKKFRARNQSPVSLDESFVDAALEYSWPGNVRELENVAQRLSLLYPGKKVTAKNFRRLSRRYHGSQAHKLVDLVSEEQASEPSKVVAEPSLPELLNQSVNIDKPMAENIDPVVEHMERQYLAACLRANRGRVSQTAEQAGVHRRTLLRKMKQYELDKKDFKIRGDAEI